MSAWDNPEFAAQWNDDYGLDMSKAPTRAGLIYPLVENGVRWPESQSEAIRIVDLGCGNGNLIRAFVDRPFVSWLGIDSGSAILETARPLENSRNVQFLNRDIGREISEIHVPGFDHVVSIFTLEEIPFENTAAFFGNMAKAVCARSGCVHIFTQHPVYVFQQDILAQERGVPNEKFQGQRGYFDAEPTTYTLAKLNSEKGVLEKPSYHHKTLAVIMKGLADVGLYLQDMVEIPAGVISMEGLRAHEPKRGDSPRFLYLRAQYRHALKASV